MTTKEVFKKHEIHIRPAINGFIVNCGCQGPIIFSSWTQLREELDGIYCEGAKLGPIAKMVLEEYEKNSVHPNIGAGTT